jgi:hypothetical protein
MMGGMFFMMIWMVLGGLLFLALLVVLIWLLVRWLNTTQRTPAGPSLWQRDSPEGYRQGYRSSSLPREIPPQENEGAYYASPPPYEQPQVQYPQEQRPPWQ